MLMTIGLQYSHSWTIPLEESIVDVISYFQKQKKKPIIVGAMGGPFTEKISQQIEDTNVPVYHSVIEWVTAAGALAKWASVRGQAK